LSVQDDLQIFGTAACGQFPAVPSTELEWKTLHRRHVDRVTLAWTSILTELGIDSLVIHSGKPQKRNSLDDQFWPTVTTPHFLHWLAYEETEALLVFSVDSSKPRVYTMRNQSFWDSPGKRHLTWDESCFRVEEVTEFSGINLPSSATYIGDDIYLAGSLGISADQCNRLDVLSAGNFLRTLKSEYEVASIAKANDLAAKGHLAVMDKFMVGDVSELELHLHYLKMTGQTEFSAPYGNIVAMGSNAAVLHHVNYGTESRMGDLSLLVDAGAKVNGYASDITRTWARGSGRGISLFRDLIVLVDSTQKKLVSRVTVGEDYELVHNFAHQLIAEVLIEVGLLNCSPHVAVESGLTRVFFPHGLGHSLGLQVHDVGMKLKDPASNNQYLRNTTRITQGQVVTVEPGIYFIQALLKDALKEDFSKFIQQEMVELLMPFGGVRIEDNILATDAGPVNLSLGVPRI
jgi:Xaa-Pro dipeptidase